MCAMPTAKVGAPPVRPTIFFSPTLAASADISPVVTGKPRAVTLAVTTSGVPAILMAKYWPGSIAHAAMRAMMPTHISVTIAP